MHVQSYRGAITHSHTYGKADSKKKKEKRKSERQWSADVFNSNPKNGAVATVLTMPLSINKKLEEKKKSVMTTDFKHSRPH